MKTNFLTALLLISAVAYSQVNRDDRKAALKMARSHIKSKTQTDYPYVYDINSGLYKPSPSGAKVESQTYDSKGNVIMDVQYDDYGNVGGKIVSKYDVRGNCIEDDSYNGDGTINYKAFSTYNKDTVTLFKAYTGDGKLNNVRYTRTKHWRDTTPNTPQFYEKHKLLGNIYVVDYYNQQDSSIMIGGKYVYDDAGNWIYMERYKSFDGKTINLIQKDGWKYDAKNEMVEHDGYNPQSDDVTFTWIYKYDDKGNVVEISLSQDSGDYHYVYKNDAKGNPVSAIKYDNSNNPVTFTKYTYTYYQ